MRDNSMPHRRHGPENEARLPAAGCLQRARLASGNRREVYRHDPPHLASQRSRRHTQRVYGPRERAADAFSLLTCDAFVRH